MVDLVIVCYGEVEPRGFIKVDFVLDGNKPFLKRGDRGEAKRGEEDSDVQPFHYHVNR